MRSSQLVFPSEPFADHSKGFVDDTATHKELRQKGTLETFYPSTGPDEPGVYEQKNRTWGLRVKLGESKSLPQHQPRHMEQLGLLSQGDAVSIE